MDQNKVAVKSKAKKSITNKKAKSEKGVAPTVIEAHGLILTLDNSIKKYANDPFFVKKNVEANKKFAQNKADL